MGSLGQALLLAHTKVRPHVFVGSIPTISAAYPSSKYNVVKRERSSWNRPICCRNMHAAVHHKASDVPVGPLTSISLPQTSFWRPSHPLLGLGFGQAPGGESGREQSGVQQFALCMWAPTVQR